MRPRQIKPKFKVGNYVENAHTGIVKVVGAICNSKISGDEIFRGELIVSNYHWRPKGTVIPDFLVDCFERVSKTSLRQRGILIHNAPQDFQISEV